MNNNVLGHSLYLVSISGGVDSTALIEFAGKMLPHNKIQFVHAVIDIDWEETRSIVMQQVEHARVKFGYDFPLHFVQASFADGRTKGFLDKLVAPRKKRDGTIIQNMFPSMQARWCTSELKIAPIKALTRKLLPNGGTCLNITGERHDESRQRSKLAAFEACPTWNHKGKNIEVFNYRPVLTFNKEQIRNIGKGYAVHPCYSWGVSRASCAICVFSSDKEIVIAAKHAPNVVKRYIDAERKIDHTFKYKPATKKRGTITLTVEQILKNQGVTL